MAMRRDTYSMQTAKVSGRKFFHSRCISWSYRNQGYDARIHRNSMGRQRVLMVKLIVYSSGVRGLWNAPQICSCRYLESFKIISSSFLSPLLVCIAAVTNHHKVGSIKQHTFIVSDFRRPEACHGSHA
jgi:hypothetical protein